MRIIFLILILLSLQSCSDTTTENTDSTNETVTEGDDITDSTFTNRSANCEDYSNQYYSTVLDVQNNNNFTGEIAITVSDNTCTITANSIPNHDFNHSPANFATVTSEIAASYDIPSNPTIANSITELSLSYNDAIFLNGVKLDLLSAGCYNVGSGMVGCNDSYLGIAWRYDPMSPLNSFGTDSHNAHTQPDGQYHYHGNPNAMFEENIESPLIGFAADGFPIYGPYINDNGTIREVLSSYTLKNDGGAREELGTEANSSYFPGGNYDGTYNEDYEYQENLGDLDECNGMTDADGNYGYYVSNSYPWVLKCFKGTVDSSFRKN